LKDSDLKSKQWNLITELNPDGTKDIKITNEQIVERAIELYNESNANEMKQSH
jgi:hypothetical protein